MCIASIATGKVGFPETEQFSLNFQKYVAECLERQKGLKREMKGKSFTFLLLI